MSPSANGEHRAGVYHQDSERWEKIWEERRRWRHPSVRGEKDLEAVEANRSSRQKMEIDQAEKVLERKGGDLRLLYKLKLWI